MGFHAVRADGDRITAAVLINPFAFDWEDELTQELDVGRTRQLRRVDGWKRLLSGGVSGERIRGVAAHALRRPWSAVSAGGESTIAFAASTQTSTGCATRASRSPC